MENLEQITTIATSTFYKAGSANDEMRAELAKRFVREAVRLGYSLVIVDCGSSDELLKNFQSYGQNVHVYLEQKMSLGQSRRHAIKLALELGKSVIATTEPEKVDYIHNISETVKPIIDGSADLVVPSRRSLNSYPVVQQYAEMMGNIFWKELTGNELDMWFGPRTFRKEMSTYFLDYNEEYGGKWDSIFIPVMDAIVDGKIVKSVVVDYTHPIEQTSFEEHDLSFHIKRFKQLENLIPALETHWKKRTGKRV